MTKTAMRTRTPKSITDSLTRAFTRRYASNKHADVADIPAYGVNEFDHDIQLAKDLTPYLPDYMAPAARM